MGKTTPKCLGHYEMAHPDCDGNPPCSFKPACRSLQDYLRRIGATVDATKSSSSEDTLRYLAWASLHGEGSRKSSDYKRHWLMWNRFVEAFRLALPSGTQIVPKRELAIPNEIYVALDRANRDRSGLPASFKVSVKSYSTSSVDCPILRLWPRPLSVVEPTVSLRCTPEKLLARYPEVRSICRRVEGRLSDIRSNTTNNVALDTSLRRIYPEYVEDVARLAARMLLAGELTDMTWPLNAETFRARAQSRPRRASPST